MPPVTAPPNPYSTLASMPGPAPAAKKKNDKMEELMKGAHGVIKALNKMDEMSGGGSKEIASCIKNLKDYVANVLKGDPSTLDEEKKEEVPPPAEADQPPPESPAPTTAPEQVPA